jgi:hypothetical protein
MTKRRRIDEITFDDADDAAAGRAELDGEAVVPWQQRVGVREVLDADQAPGVVAELPVKRCEKSGRHLHLSDEHVEPAHSHS